MNEKKKPTSKIDSEYRIEAGGGLFHPRFCFTLFLEDFDYEGVRDYK